MKQTELIQIQSSASQNKREYHELDGQNKSQKQAASADAPPIHDVLELKSHLLSGYYHISFFQIHQRTTPIDRKPTNMLLFT